MTIIETVRQTISTRQLTVKEITQVTGLPEKSVSNCISALIKADQIKRKKLENSPAYRYQLKGRSYNGQNDFINAAYKLEALINRNKELRNELKSNEREIIRVVRSM